MSDIVDEGAYQFYIDEEPRRKFEETQINKFNKEKREENRKETIKQLNICIKKLKEENASLKARLKRYKEYEEAEDGGLLLRLPKLGKTYYCDDIQFSSHYRGEVHEFKVNAIDTSFGYKFKGEWKYKFDIDDIGITVFPDRKTAKLAIKR